MKLRVAIQMDPIGAIDITGDSTFALALEAQNRGHELHYYEPRHLTFAGDALVARLAPLEVRAVVGDHFTLGSAQLTNLAAMDVVLMRQDPPFDMAYITATHLLERIHPKTLVVNDPAHVRNAPEKLFVLDFPDLMPPTLISRDDQAIAAFRDEHKDIIVKPLYGNGGAGVFHLQPGDDNLNSLLEMFFAASREPVIAQKFLSDVSAGDKRIILVDGEVAGAINRVPPKGEARSNMHIGGRAEPTELTAREREICEALKPELKRRGLIFTGIDVIGDWLTEINVTSPTGIQEVKRFGGADIAALIWDAIERKRA